MHKPAKRTATHKRRTMAVESTVGIRSMPDVMSLLKILIAIKRWWRPLRPLRIIPKIKLDPAQICADVTNVSGDDQLLVRCIARITYPKTTILRRHLRHPLTPPRLYRTIWYGGIGFELIRLTSSIRLAPNEPTELCHSLSYPPVFPPMILIEVQLSDGRVVRSDRLRVLY
jgi:hypothetical protein